MREEKNADSIMSPEQIGETINVLTREELIGKKMLRLYGRNIDYAEYIYLLQHQALTEPEQMMTPQAVREQGQTRMEYEKYREFGLTEADFFPAEEDVVVEKLLHFVDIPEHRHEFYECSYVVSGSCSHVIDGHEFVQGKGSFVFIPPMVPHVLCPIEDGLCLTVKIRDLAFQKMSLPSISSFAFPLAFQCPDDPVLLRTFQEMYLQETGKKDHYSQMISLMFHTVILYILQNYEEQSTILSPTAKKRGIMKILNYIADNYSTVTMRDVAEHFHYNEAYFSRMFREQANRPFSDLLRAYKLRRASYLLQETSMSLDEICDEIGYKDVPRFIRNFKEEYGMTPGKYRKSVE